MAVTAGAPPPLGSAAKTLGRVITIAGGPPANAHDPVSVGHLGHGRAAENLAGDAPGVTVGCDIYCVGQHRLAKSGGQPSGDVAVEVAHAEDQQIGLLGLHRHGNTGGDDCRRCVLGSMEHRSRPMIAELSQRCVAAGAHEHRTELTAELPRLSERFEGRSGRFAVRFS